MTDDWDCRNASVLMVATGGSRRQDKIPDISWTRRHKGETRGAFCSNLGRRRGAWKKTSTTSLLLPKRPECRQSVRQRKRKACLQVRNPLMVWVWRCDALNNLPQISDEDIQRAEKAAGHSGQEEQLRRHRSLLARAHLMMRKINVISDRDIEPVREVCPRGGCLESACRDSLQRP